MALHIDQIITIDGANYRFTVAQDSDNTNGFYLSFPNDRYGRYPTFNLQGLRIPITESNIQLGTFNPANNIFTARHDIGVATRSQRIEFDMLETSVFEAWAVPFQASYTSSSNTPTNHALIFDVFKPNRITNEARAITFHGLSRSPHVADWNRFIVSHASNYYARESEANTREIIQIIQGDSETQTGYGFNNTPKLVDGKVKVIPTTPPSVSEIRSDIIQYALRSLSLIHI